MIIQSVLAELELHGPVYRLQATNSHNNFPFLMGESAIHKAACGIGNFLQENKNYPTAWDCS